MSALLPTSRVHTNDFSMITCKRSLRASTPKTISRPAFAQHAQTSSKRQCMLVMITQTLVKLRYKSHCVEESLKQLEHAIRGGYVHEMIVSASLATTLKSDFLSGCAVRQLTYQSTELPTGAGIAPFWPAIHGSITKVKSLSLTSQYIEDYGHVADAFLHSCIQRGTSIVSIKNQRPTPLRITDDGILDFLFGNGRSSGARVLELGHCSVSKELMKKLAQVS